MNISTVLFIVAGGLAIWNIAQPTEKTTRLSWAVLAVCVGLTLGFWR